jgi:hypothetical protein
LVKIFLAAIEACGAQPVPPSVAPWILCPRGATSDDVEAILETVIEDDLVDLFRDPAGALYFKLSKRGALMLQKTIGGVC